MRKKDENVPGHDQNGRSFLAEVVQAQQVELTNLGKEVASLNATVATLLEADRRASTYRSDMYREVNSLKAEVNAVRSEQQQLVQSSVATQTGISEIKKILTEIEGERRDVKTIGRFVGQSAKIAWTLFGAAATALVTYIWKTWQGAVPPPGGHP